MRAYDVVKSIQDLRHLSWDERATTSGTAGTYLKSRSGEGARKLYYKLSRFNGFEIDGHECVNEIIASRLMDILGVEHLAYRLVHARICINGEEHTTWLNSSKNFRARGERKQAFDAFFGLRRASGESPYEFCQRYGWEKHVKQMMVVDYLIANRDRHGANIEVLVDAAGIARLAPLFDNGLSFVAPYAGDEGKVASFDPLTDVRTANFIGSRSLEENMRDAASVPGIGVLAESDAERLFAGLEEALPEVYRQKIWEIIWERWKRYEAIRNS